MVLNFTYMLMNVQLYCSFNPKSSSSIQNAIMVIEKCFWENSEWMIQNIKLLMNIPKTELF